MYITVEEAKQHIYVDFVDDDELIESMILAAEQSIEKYLNTDFDTIVKNNNGELPHSIKLAIKILVGNFYANRESVSFNSVPYRIPFSFEYLLQPFKNYKREEVTK